MAALGRRAYPAQARDLHFLAGALCALMANASLDLGREETADDLARAAWTHAQVIDHGPLMGWAAAPRPSPPSGTAGTRMPSSVLKTDSRTSVLAAAGSGCTPFAPAPWPHTATSPRLARPSLLPPSAHADTVPDDLHGGLGGEFAFDDAKLAYYQALTLTDDHDPVALGHAAQAAIRLYQALPARPGPTAARLSPGFSSPAPSS